VTSGRAPRPRVRRGRREARVTDPKVKCEGATSCKGKSSCKSGKNACSGKNGCAGKAWVVLTKEACKAKGGKDIGKADEPTETKTC
jgi:hypothetical protein